MRVPFGFFRAGPWQFVATLSTPAIVQRLICSMFHAPCATFTRVGGNATAVKLRTLLLFAGVWFDGAFFVLVQRFYCLAIKRRQPIAWKWECKTQITLLRRLNMNGLLRNTNGKPKHPICTFRLDGALICHFNNKAMFISSGCHSVAIDSQKKKQEKPSGILTK